MIVTLIHFNKYKDFTDLIFLAHLGIQTFLIYLIFVYLPNLIEQIKQNHFCTKWFYLCLISLVYLFFYWILTETKATMWNGLEVSIINSGQHCVFHNDQFIWPLNLWK